MKQIMPLLVILTMLSISQTATAQTVPKKYLHDSTYYEMYRDKLTLRLYTGQKVTHFVIPSGGAAHDVEYRANHKLNVGFGATWHNYSLSAFYGFGFMNKDYKLKGKTKSFDFQFHLYPHKWAIDLYAMNPKGMYLSPKGFAAANSSSYYYRPDVKQTLFGLSAYRVPNKEKFSYRAAIVQNEWQKKSAGSLLFGGEAVYGIVQGDSALIPKAIESGYPQKGISKISYFTIAPGIGYAYTLVMGQHFYIMGSLVGNLDINFATEEIGSSSTKKTSVSPSEVFKAAIGYNSSNWGFNVSATGRSSQIKGSTTNKDYYIPNGAYRVSLTKKIDMHKKK